MPLTWSDTAGFEYSAVHNGCFKPGREYPLKPGTVFTAGMAVFLDVAGNYIRPATSSDTRIRGTMQDTITTGTTKTEYGRVFDDPDIIYVVSFKNHRDATATSGTTTTLVDSTLAIITNDAFRGSMLYVYDGPGAGTVRLVDDYDGATKTLTWLEPAHTAITNASKYILFGAGAAINDGISMGSRGIKLYDANSIDVGSTIVGAPGPFIITQLDPVFGRVRVQIISHDFIG